jgi:hypothetical protein
MSNTLIEKHVPLLNLSNLKPVFSEDAPKKPSPRDEKSKSPREEKATPRSSITSSRVKEGLKSPSEEAAFGACTPRFKESSVADRPFYTLPSDFDVKKTGRCTSSFSNKGSRFVYPKSDTPSSTYYTVNTEIRQSVRGDPGFASFKMSAPRFVYPKQITPPPGSYDPKINPFGAGDVVSTNFKSITPRFSTKKRTACDVMYDLPSSFKQSQYPSAAFSSKSARIVVV